MEGLISIYGGKMPVSNPQSSKPWKHDCCFSLDFTVSQNIIDLKRHSYTVMINPDGNAAPFSRSNGRDELARGDWRGASSVFIGLLISLSVAFVFVAGTCVLNASLKPTAHIWLPEIVEFISSADTRPQRWGFLIAAALFGTILAGTVLKRPGVPRWLVIAGEALSSSLDPGHWTASLPGRDLQFLKVFRCYGPRWLNYCALWLCIIVVLTIFTSEYIKSPAYVDDMLMQVKESDPHIYAIFGRAGEILFGRFDEHSTGVATYGFGQAAIYAVGRYLGASGSYYYAYEIARFSNLLAVLVFFWALFRPQFARLTCLSTFLVISTATCVALPLLLPSNFSTFTANLSGLRYVPMLLFIVAAGLAVRVNGISLLMLSGSAALGFAYSADVGVISLVGYVVFVGLGQGQLSARVLRVSVFFAVSMVAVIALNFFVQDFLPGGLLGVLEQAASFERGGYGGVVVTFSLLNSVIAGLFVTTASMLFLESNSRILGQEERFVAAVSVMGFIWYFYYLHRPGPLYWIYSYLAVFNLRYFMGRTSDWMTGASRVGAILVMLPTAVIAQANYRDVKLGLRLERQTDRGFQSGAVATLSGIKVDSLFAHVMKERVRVLDRLRTPDCMVVTAFPYLVSMESHIVNPPYDIMSSMPAYTDIDSFVADVLKRRPARLFLEPDDTQAWGAEATAAVVHRIEQEISGDYRRDESIGEWRVWNLMPRIGR